MKKIALLRGINVSGKNKLPMADLRKMLGELGISRVETYIQSGNVVFEMEKGDNSSLETLIGKGIHQYFGLTIPVLVRTEEEWARAISENPFLKEAGIEEEFLHLTWLASEPSSSNWEKLTGMEGGPDRYSRIGDRIYLYCPGGYGNTKLSNGFFEGKLKVVATTRNWKTVRVLENLGKKG